MCLLCILRHKGYENTAQSPQFCDLIKIRLWGKETKGMLAVPVIDKLMFHFLKVRNNSGNEWLLNSVKCQERSSWNQFGGKRDNVNCTESVRLLVEQRNWKTPILYKDAPGLRSPEVSDWPQSANRGLFLTSFFFSKFFLRGGSVSQQFYHQYL